MARRVGKEEGGRDSKPPKAKGESRQISIKHFLIQNGTECFGRQKWVWQRLEAEPSINTDQEAN